ncbi:hypothetical protein K435DRAFT_878807 [Dendrothele bispora CBS 962.96]|uniref:Uncharacterized protein n=1 Tax=Dendrothele bispora (strain CBS 962.96) TaxID=1314807 RepID=A0A4S8KMB5_DENBC|nr:hypothetical protein K435DRAFT_878807 [Dendrothele bispora CBS 962.96]
MPFIAGIYPLAIILFVATENQKENAQEMSLSQSIRFASAASTDRSNIENNP